MKCQNCGHNNQQDAVKCSRCGQPLSVSDDVLDLDALYAPVAPATDDDFGKTAIYVEPEEKPVQDALAVPDPSKTVVKPVVSEVAQTIIKEPAPVDSVQPEVSKTVVRPATPEAAKTIVAPASPVAAQTIVAPASSAPAQTVVRPAAQEVANTVVQETAKTVVSSIPPITAKNVSRESVQNVPVNQTIRQTIVKCPHCGFYPVLSSATECPKCGESMATEAEKIEKAEGKVEEEKPVVDNIYEKTATEPGNEQQGTVCRPFYLHNSVDTLKKGDTPKPKAKPVFKLTLIPEVGDQVTAVTRQFDGEKVILNRDNTEPLNMSITSKEQAEVKFKDGRWFIENKSELNSTYLLVGRPVELQSGDIIILGDRQFKFEA